MTLSIHHKMFPQRLLALGPVLGAQNTVVATQGRPVPKDLGAMMIQRGRCQDRRTRDSENKKVGCPAQKEVTSRLDRWIENLPEIHRVVGG